MIISNQLTIDMTPVTEAYYGKPKEFLECERLLKQMIVIINKEYDPKNIRKGKNERYGPKDAKEFAKLNDQFEKAFAKGLGIRSCEIIWQGTDAPISLVQKRDGEMDIVFTPDVGAKTFTIPSAFNMMTKAFKKNPRRDNINMKIFFDKAMIYTMSLDAEESMAIILHEAGHNLDFSIFHLMSSTIPDIRILTDADVFADYVKEWLIAMFIQLPLIKWFAKAGNELIEYLKSHVPHINTVLSVISRYAASIQSLANKISHFGMAIDPTSYLFAAINPRSLFGYGGEKFADSTPTAYGYGPANIRAQQKMQRFINSGFIPEKEIPGYSIISELPTITTRAIFSITDEHPDSAIRIYAQVRKLKRDLNDPRLSKELRAELESQLNECEELCKEIVDIRAKPNKYFFFTTLWNKFMIDVLKGYGDPRELMELVWRHEM